MQNIEDQRRSVVASARLTLQERYRMANLKTAAMLFVVTAVFVLTFLPASLTSPFQSSHHCQLNTTVDHYHLLSLSPPPFSHLLFLVAGIDRKVCRVVVSPEYIYLDWPVNYLSTCIAD